MDFVNVLLDVLVFRGSELAMRTFLVEYLIMHSFYVMLQTNGRSHNFSTSFTRECVVTFVLTLSKDEIKVSKCFQMTT